MRDQEKSRRSGKTTFERGVELLSMPLSAVMTFFTGPRLFNGTVDFAVNYANHDVGAGWETPVSVMWWMACIVGTFGFWLMLLALTLRLGAAKFSGWVFGD